jgi:hypothetical protein
VCSGLVPCFESSVARPPVCEKGVQCRSATGSVVLPEVFGAPATATFIGGASLPGSVGSPAVVPVKGLSRAQMLAAALKKCRGDRVRARRLGCERLARARYGPKARKSKGGVGGGGRKAGRSVAGSAGVGGGR